MNPQLSAFLQQNKPVVLGVAGVGVVGLALLSRKRKATAPAAAGAGAAQPAGTLPAAVVAAPAAASGYDSTATDVYNSMEGQLQQLQAQQAAQTGTNSGPLAAPSPVASTLFAPTGSGQYLRYGNLIGEVEQDGSLYSLSYPEWAKLQANGASFQQVADNPGAMPKAWTGSANIAQRANSFTTPGSPPPPTVKS